ncbi:hypothetical protein D3C71_18830 [compost metagenome]
MISMQDISKHRAQLCRALQKILTPHCKPSGYRDRQDSKGKSMPLKVWHEPKANGQPKEFSLRGSRSFDSFEGFTPKSLVEEFSFGAVTIPFSSMPLEDLVKVHQWVSKKFAAA